MKIPKDTIIEKIKEKTGLSDKEIDAKIKDKLKSLSGLISEEGAAHIVANQLGVKLVDENGPSQIKDIMPGMRNVSIKGRVVRVYEVRDFTSGERKGKVGSFLLGDDSGVIRATCWNEKADLISGLKEGMIVKVESGYIKESRDGRKELHVADRGDLKIEGMGEGPVRTPLPDAARKSISQLKGGEENVEIFGTIVQVFDPRFFEVCPQCNKRARAKEEGFACDVHGNVTPAYSCVLNLILDDGTENIRVVMWKNQTIRLLGINEEQLVALKDVSFEDTKTNLLGQMLKLIGRCTRNEMFDRTEFVANQVYTNPDPKDEMRRLEKEPKPAKPKEAPKKPKAKEEDEEILSLEDLENL